MSEQQGDQEEISLPDLFRVLPDEILLRGITCDPDYYKNGNVLPAAFTPRKPRPDKDPDKDGISLHRKAFLSPQQFRASNPDERRKLSMGVAELPVQLVLEMGLSVVPDTEIPLPEPIGHVTIREINSAYWSLDVDSKLYRDIRGWITDLAKACVNVPIIPAKPANNPKSTNS